MSQTIVTALVELNEI